MNKQELIAHIAAAADLTKAQAARALEAATDAIRAELAVSNDVVLAGFGTFTAVRRAQREGRNPATGESITIPASWTPKFKPGKALKEAVN